MTRGVNSNQPQANEGSFVACHIPTTFTLFVNTKYKTQYTMTVKKYFDDEAVEAPSDYSSIDKFTFSDEEEGGDEECEDKDEDDDDDDEDQDEEGANPFIDDTRLRHPVPVHVHRQMDFTRTMQRDAEFSDIVAPRLPFVSSVAAHVQAGGDPNDVQRFFEQLSGDEVDAMGSNDDKEEEQVEARPRPVKRTIQFVYSGTESDEDQDNDAE